MNLWVERYNRRVQCMCLKYLIEIFFHVSFNFCVQNYQSIKFVSHFHMFQITHKLTSLFDVDFDSKAALVNYAGLYVWDANFALSPYNFLWEVQNFSKKAVYSLIFTTWKNATNCTNCTSKITNLNTKNNSHWLSKLWFLTWQRLIFRCYGGPTHRNVTSQQDRRKEKKWRHRRTR